MEYDAIIEVELPVERTNKDWLKASDASLAKLQEVGTKIYNLGIADTRQLRATKNNLHAKTDLAEGTKCAWGSNGSIPDLLRKHNERQRQQKATRPVSAKVTTHTQPTKTRRRPQSAKELSNQEAAQEKKPPTGLGVKGMHRDLEERPPGGIGVGLGAGWAAPPGGVLDMSGREIDDLLSQVSDSQRPARSQAAWQQGIASGIPPPPRGSPDFSEMLNTKNGQGPTFKSMIEDLLFDKNMLPSEILTHPPPEPIHITMPHATLGGDEDPSESIDEDNEDLTSDRRTPTQSSNSRPGYKQKSTLLEVNNFNDQNPWQSCDETDDEEILLEASPRRTPLRMRTVTFNEEKNETTLITPRGAKSHRAAQEELERISNDSQSSTSTSGYDVLEDQLPKQHKDGQDQVELPKPKTYQGRADLKWVKSRTDSGIPLTSQDEGGKGVSRKGSGGKVPSSAGNTAAAAEQRVNNVPTVSVAYFDLGPEEDKHTTTTPAASGKSSSKKTRQANLEEVETMVSRVAAEAEEQHKELELVGNKSGTSDVQWATPGSVKTKVVSSGAQKNYYELALQARMAKHRSQITAKEDDNKKTKTIKTFEFGDGEVIEHKSVSTVDTLQHQKKEYVLPKDARPQSASTKTTKPHENTQAGAKDRSVNTAGSTTSEQYAESTSSSQSKVGESSSHVGTGTQGKPTIQVNGVNQNQRPTSGLHPGTSAGSSSQRPGSSRGNRAVTSSADRSVDRPPSRQGSRDVPQKSMIRDSKKESRTSIQTDHLYDEFQNVKLKKQRAVSAPVRRGPTIENGKLTGAGSGLGILASSPYATPTLKPRPYSASMVSDMKKRPGSGQNIKISTKLSFNPLLACYELTSGGCDSPVYAADNFGCLLKEQQLIITLSLGFREIQRVKTAAKLVKKGTLGHPKVYNLEKHYANYSKPPPPAPFVPVLRKKKMEAVVAAATAATEKEKKESSIVQMWTRQDDFEVETEGIQECKKLQDKLLEQGVPVTLDTLTRALLPPGECAMRGSTYVTSTNPTLPEDTSRLLSKPAIWFPEEFNRLQRARKLAQRAELSVKEQDWDDRNMYMQSSMSASTTNKKTKKKKKKKKKAEDLMSRSSSGY